MSSSAAEKKVKKLARLPSNTVCANCGTTKKFGFSTVCIKYFTFVCNNCKSSHQAISHRCKSLTMSSWTDEEAAELQRKGNDYARRTWLKNAPPVGQGGRPKEGDPVDVFKRFVVDVYERKRYYWEDDGNVGATSAPPVVANHVPRVATGATTVRRAPVRKAAPPPAPPPAAPVADLLDFTSMASALPQSGGSNDANPVNTFEANFDAFAPAASVPAPSAGAKTVTAASKNDPFTSSTTQTTATSSGSSSAFKADFDVFAPTATVPSSGPPASVNNTVTPIKNDPFQPSITSTTTTSTGSSFSFINNNNVNATPPPAPTPTKKPVMNNSTMSQNSSLISSMSMPAPRNIQQGRNPMGTGMGWNSSNNSNAFGGLGNMQSMQQQTTMMQQQQMNMMNGMSSSSSPMNNNVMGVGMMNNNPMMMMGNNNSNMMMMMGKNNAMMMNPQHTMMNGNGFGGSMMPNNANGKSKGTMQSLQMNSASMSAWSGGFK